MNNKTLLDLFGEYINKIKDIIIPKNIEIINSLPVSVPKLSPTNNTREISELSNYYDQIESLQKKYNILLTMLNSSVLKNKIAQSKSDTFYANFITINDSIVTEIHKKQDECSDELKFIQHELQSYGDIKYLKSITNVNWFTTNLLKVINAHAQMNQKRIIDEFVVDLINKLMNNRKITVNNFMMCANRFNLIPYKTYDLTIIFKELGVIYDKTIDPIQNIKQLNISSYIIYTKATNVYDLNKIYSVNTNAKKTPITAIATKYIINNTNIIYGVPQQTEEGIVFNDKKTDKCLVFMAIGTSLILMTQNYNDLYVNHINFCRELLPLNYNTETLQFEYRDTDFKYYNEIETTKETIINYQFENMRHMLTSFLSKKEKDLKIYLDGYLFQNELKEEIFRELSKDTMLYANELHITLLIFTDKLANYIKRKLGEYYYEFFSDEPIEYDQYLTKITLLSKKCMEYIQYDTQFYNTYMRNIKHFYFKYK